MLLLAHFRNPSEKNINLLVSPTNTESPKKHSAFQELTSFLKAFSSTYSTQMFAKAGKFPFFIASSKNASMSEIGFVSKYKLLLHDQFASTSKLIIWHEFEQVNSFTNLKGHINHDSSVADKLLAQNQKVCLAFINLHHLWRRNIRLTTRARTNRPAVCSV